MLKEFKTFIMRGNVVDLAVGVVIGASFGAIVTSIVNGSSQAFPSLAAAKAAGAPTLNYGLFINAVINFLIVALAVFVVVKQINRLFPKSPALPATKECGHCAMSIPLRARRCPHCTSELAAA